MPFTLFNEECFVSAVVDDENDTITLQLAHTEKPIFITADDEMYGYNLQALTTLKDGILAKATKKKEKEKETN